ncbi:unnamed protein product [Diplocarpon coronariae]
MPDGRHRVPWERGGGGSPQVVGRSTARYSSGSLVRRAGRDVLGSGAPLHLRRVWGESVLPTTASPWNSGAELVEPMLGGNVGRQCRLQAKHPRPVRVPSTCVGCGMRDAGCGMRDARRKCSDGSWKLFPCMALPADVDSDLRTERGSEAKSEWGVRDGASWSKMRCPYSRRDAKLPMKIDSTLPPDPSRER